MNDAAGMETCIHVFNIEDVEDIEGMDTWRHIINIECIEAIEGSVYHHHDVWHAPAWYLK